jgi:hypothetical protein
MILYKSKNKPFLIKFRSKHDLKNKSLSDEINDIKVIQYVKRVNDALRQIILDRKEIIYRENLGFVS